MTLQSISVENFLEIFNFDTDIFLFNFFTISDFCFLKKCKECLKSILKQLNSDKSNCYGNYIE